MVEALLKSFIEEKSFPCIMARAVAKKGRFQVLSVDKLNLDSVQQILHSIYQFIDEFRSDKQTLSSFALVVQDEEVKHDFKKFEHEFWDFLHLLNDEDKASYPPDPRVAPHSMDDNFSFSLKSEAFFLVVLHPQSPRWARRFWYPAIIFNPHIQFEKMREKGVFKKVRDIIRQKDKLLQGSINPMLNDFGEKSEVYQYLGRPYSPDEIIPLNI